VVEAGSERVAACGETKEEEKKAKVPSGENCYLQRDLNE